MKVSGVSAYFNKLEPGKMMLLLSILLSAFIIYPNIIGISFHFTAHTAQFEKVEYISFFIFRYLFFCALTWGLLSINTRKLETLVFSKRLLKSVGITLVAYAVYVIFSLIVSTHMDCFTGLLLFQFAITCLLCTFIGYFFALYAERIDKEKLIEQLKVENLQSRCDALQNQINPHFFFNVLNNVSALVREDDKEKTFAYIHKLSGVFRYILQSDKKGLVTLGEELSFLEAFRYVLEVRYADRLKFRIEVDKHNNELILPVLSLLPIIENVVKHNVVDSDNLMEIFITVNENDELVVTNPIHEKIEPATGNGIGLSNLSSRFLLLTETEMRIQVTDESFTVILPLIKR